MDSSIRNFTDGGRDLKVFDGSALGIAEAFVSLSSDVALIVRPDGVVEHVVEGAQGRIRPSADDWLGRPWSETVTSECRGKVAQLLQEVRATGRSRRREVNHLTDVGQVPVAYTALELEPGGSVLAVGQDLRAVASAQQRFLEAQRALETSYGHARRVESRYRAVFQNAVDAAVLVEPKAFTIVECNDAAAVLFDLRIEDIVGRPAWFAFDRLCADAVRERLAAVSAHGGSAEIEGRLMRRPGRVSVAVIPLRIEHGPILMMRVLAQTATQGALEFDAAMARWVNSSPDGVVVTDFAGRIVLGNEAFVDLCKVDCADGLTGRYLSDWVAVDDGDWPGLLRGVRARGEIRDRSASVGALGDNPTRLLLIGTLLVEGDPERLAFTLRRATSPGTPERGAWKP